MEEKLEKPAREQKKRPRFSESEEGSSCKGSLSILAVASTMVPSPVDTSPAGRGPSPVAMTNPPAAVVKPASTVAMTTTPPALAAPSPNAMVKPIVVKEPEDGGGAMLSMVAEDKTVPNLDLKKNSKWVHCAACHDALKPPLFMCGDEHAVCCDCAGASKHCGECGGAANYTRVPRFMDGLVGALELPCPYNKFGCGASIAYHAVAEHKARCAHAPCYCRECYPTFEGSPASLLRHLTDPSGRHRWPVEKIEYEAEQRFFVPTSSKGHRRLLVAEDGRMFLLAVDAAGRGCRLVTVVCVRGNGRPAYKGTLTVECPPDQDGDEYNVKLNAKVASCRIPSDVDMEDGLLIAHVTRKMLHGHGDSMTKLHLRVRIAKFP